MVDTNLKHHPAPSPSRLVEVNPPPPLGDIIRPSIARLRACLRVLPGNDHLRNALFALICFDRISTLAHHAGEDGQTAINSFRGKLNGIEGLRRFTPTEHETLAWARREMKAFLPTKPHGSMAKAISVAMPAAAIVGLSDMWMDQLGVQLSNVLLTPLAVTFNTGPRHDHHAILPGMVKDFTTSPQRLTEAYPHRATQDAMVEIAKLGQYLTGLADILHERAQGQPVR